LVQHSFAFGLFAEAEAVSELRRAGVPEEHQRVYLDLAWTMPGYAELREMLWRKKVSPERLREALRYSKIPSDLIDGYEGLTKAIPSVSDIITMMVREVFVPERFELRVLEGADQPVFPA